MLGKRSTRSTHFGGMWVVGDRSAAHLQRPKGSKTEMGHVGGVNSQGPDEPSHGEARSRDCARSQ